MISNSLIGDNNNVNIVIGRGLIFPFNLVFFCKCNVSTSYRTFVISAFSLKAVCSTTDQLSICRLGPTRMGPLGERDVFLWL